MGSNRERSARTGQSAWACAVCYFKQEWRLSEAEISTQAVISLVIETKFQNPPLGLNEGHFVFSVHGVKQPAAFPYRWVDRRKVKLFY